MVLNHGKILDDLLVEEIKVTIVLLWIHKLSQLSMVIFKSVPHRQVKIKDRAVLMDRWSLLTGGPLVTTVVVNDVALIDMWSIWTVFYYI